MLSLSVKKSLDKVLSLTWMMSVLMICLIRPPALCYLATPWGGGDLSRRGLEQKMAV